MGIGIFRSVNLKTNQGLCHGFGVRRALQRDADLIVVPLIGCQIALCILSYLEGVGRDCQLRRLVALYIVVGIAIFLFGSNRTAGSRFQRTCQIGVLGIFCKADKAAAVGDRDLPGCGVLRKPAGQAAAGKALFPKDDLAVRADLHGGFGCHGQQATGEVQSTVHNDIGRGIAADATQTAGDLQGGVFFHSQVAAILTDAIRRQRSTGLKRGVFGAGRAGTTFNGDAEGAVLNVEFAQCSGSFGQIVVGVPTADVLSQNHVQHTTGMDPHRSFAAEECLDKGFHVTVAAQGQSKRDVRRHIQRNPVRDVDGVVRGQSDILQQSNRIILCNSILRAAQSGGERIRICDFSRFFAKCSGVWRCFLCRLDFRLRSGIH